MIDVNFNQPYVRALYVATVVTKAKIIVELGTSFMEGSSTEAFAKALRITDGELYTIDIHDYPKIKEVLKGYRVTFITGDSIDYGRIWSKGDIDILFCDSDHAYQRVYGELVTWSKWNPKLIFIHDTLIPDGKQGDPYKAGLDFCNKIGKKFINFTYPSGLGIIVM